MVQTIVTALLPIIVTLLLGFFAGWHKDFNADQAGVLNRMVMLYALPMLLASGILSTPVKKIADDLDVLLWLTIGMLGAFIVVYLVSRFIFRAGAAISALRALLISGPAVPFVGPTVLGTIFPSESSIAIAIGSLVLNILLVPITLVIVATTMPVDATAPPRSAFAVAVASVRHAVSQPVIWAPVSALVLLLLGLDMPDWLKGSFTTLGQATGGVALFAVGAVLYSQKVTISGPIVVNTLTRNLVIPALVLLGMTLAAVPEAERGLAVVTLAIPSASIAVIFAVQYKIGEREMASSLFFSTIFSVLSMGLFIWLTGS